MWTVKNTTIPNTCERMKFCNHNKMFADTNKSIYV